MQEEFIWTEKYRPKTIDDTILPKALKETFKGFVQQKNIPHMILSGGAGTGKTTTARALSDELDSDTLVINASKDRNIDTLRVEIQNFVSSVSFTGGRKTVILDEADYLNPQSTQPALRNFMEEFAGNASFILTCNFKKRLIQPLHSRCSVIDFVIPKDERPKLAGQFFKSVCGILDNENVEYDKKVVAKVVENTFPDLRKCISELQRYSATGRIDEGIFVSKTNDFKELYGILKEKSFTKARKWVATHEEIETAQFYQTLYDDLPGLMQSPSDASLVIIQLAEYEYREAFVTNAQINRTACLAQIMAEAKWK